ncbi:uncharacterized protein PHALS_05388 [Plasmopara halstedii]|uniref:Uncharacterized protein n=1 Tax=Plasmopara halstedii TaxID=4781 RepID=A0A0P1AA46_PLAHL|nr:uncharacterized protein PHALS_05388 [Plasmopara halstedii]CEG37609.1 hypothetical protein PHALS_05388 [Plasmopara halstedii]|eukprot:XP_024573978.1 hypothetical protein PHALS_05388 [Plasmopara halstedii]
MPSVALSQRKVVPKLRADAFSPPRFVILSPQAPGKRTQFELFAASVTNLHYGKELITDIILSHHAILARETEIGFIMFVCVYLKNHYHQGNLAAR